MYLTDTIKRILKPEDILVTLEYKIIVFAEKLTTPNNLMFTDRWEMIITYSGISFRSGK